MLEYNAMSYYGLVKISIDHYGTRRVCIRSHATRMPAQDNGSAT